MAYVRHQSLTGSGLDAGWASPLPFDSLASWQILNAISGSQSATLGVMTGTMWLGAELAGRPLGRGGQRILLAQTATGTMNDFGGGIGRSPPRGSGATDMLPRGALRLGGAVVTASMLLQELQRMAERQQVEAAMTRFGLDRAQAADILAARAYVWGRNMAPLNFWRVPYSGPVNERVAEALMRHERDNPGTLGLATSGNRSAGEAVLTVVEQALAGAPSIPAIALERTSAVNPALSTYSQRARGILGIAIGSQSWVAHHLIPFAVVAGLPVAFQQAIVAAGWVMDSLENLIALPANLATYLGPTNLPPNRLPYQSSSHPLYDGDVAAALAGAAMAGPAAGAAISNLAGPALRAELLRIELQFRRALLNIVRYPYYHPRLR